MSNNHKPKIFFDEPSNLDQDNFKVEIPTDSRPTYGDRIPSQYDPMGQVYLRGRAMRNLSSGTMPWWVIISGWVLFGGLFFLLVGAAISSMSLAVLLSLIFAAIPMLIVLRGTLAKLSKKQRRSR